MQGGRSYQKLGYADVNLAEFAGAKHVSQCYLLDGYSNRTRLDNSRLKVTIDMTQRSGDNLFKVLATFSWMLCYCLPRSPHRLIRISFCQNLLRGMLQRTLTLCSLHFAVVLLWVINAAILNLYLFIIFCLTLSSTVVSNGYTS